MQGKDPTGKNFPLPNEDENGPIVVPASYSAANNVAQASASYNPWWFRRQVQAGGPWDYKQQGDPTFESLGNFNYGLTGAAMDFPDGVILRQAGIVQISSPAGSNPNWGTPGPTLFGASLGFGGSGSFGDDPRDQAAISLGIGANSRHINIQTVRTGWFGAPTFP